jgi:hairy-and-enhancer-of-split protein
MLERKRRARINRCLDELKELLVGALQAEGESVSRLEKADVLELTVRHLHKLRRSQQLSENSAGERFRQGFVHCANEVSKYISTTLSSTPAGVPLDISVSSRLVTHLDQCIRQIESPQIHHHSQHPLIHPGAMPPPQGSPTGPPSQLSPVTPSSYAGGPPPAPVSMISPAGSTSSAGSNSGGGLNILTSYTPPSSPTSPNHSPSNTSNNNGHNPHHHHHHHQKIYYIPSSSLGGSSSASSTGSLSPIPPAHYNPYNSAHHGAAQQGPLSLCTKSPNLDEPFDLSNNVWRPW